MAVLVAAAVIVVGVLRVAVVRLRWGIPFQLRGVRVLVGRTGIGRFVRLLGPAFLPMGVVVLLVLIGLVGPVVRRFGVGRRVRPSVRMLMLKVGPVVLLVLILVLRVCPVPCVSPFVLLVGIRGMLRLLVLVRHVLEPLRRGSLLPLVGRVGITRRQPRLARDPAVYDARRIVVMLGSPIGGTSGRSLGHGSPASSESTGTDSYLTLLTIGQKSTVGVLLDVMPRRWDQLVEHGRMDPMRAAGPANRSRPSAF
ncbi:hypothetical protein [Micromonospora sp. NPDC050200]|uniref:hypothetical protein n=1 Tax=Micromonospora sp. NPDC050200 TaxID=3155664 RepID=UPI0033E73267